MTDVFTVRGGGGTTNEALTSARYNAARWTEGDGLGWKEAGFEFRLEQAGMGGWHVVCILLLERPTESAA